MLIKVTERKTLDVLLQDDHVVTYSALSWCVPCQRFYPHYEQASERLDVPCIYVDIEEFDDLEGLDVQSVPTVRAKLAGQEVDIRSRSAVAFLKEVTDHLA